MYYIWIVHLSVIHFWFIHWLYYWTSIITCVVLSTIYVYYLLFVYIFTFWWQCQSPTTSVQALTAVNSVLSDCQFLSCVHSGDQNLSKIKLTWSIMGWEFPVCPSLLDYFVVLNSKVDHLVKCYWNDLIG